MFYTNGVKQLLCVNSLICQRICTSTFIALTMCQTLFGCFTFINSFSPPKKPTKWVNFCPHIKYDETEAESGYMSC